MGMIRVLRNCCECKQALGMGDYTGEDAEERMLALYPAARRLTSSMALLGGASQEEAQGYSGTYELWAVSLPPPAEHNCPGWAVARKGAGDRGKTEPDR